MNSDEKRKDFLKPTDSWSTVLFADPIAVPLMKILAKLNVNPNIVTIFSLIPTLLAPYYFFRGDRISLICGALLWQLGWILDNTDGKLARFTGKTSDLGAKLDNIMEIRKPLAFLGILYSQFYIKGPKWLLIGILLVVLHHTVHFIAHYIYRIRERVYDKNRGIPYKGRLIKRVGEYYNADDEQFIIFFVSPLIGQVFWGLVMSSILYLIAVLHTIHSQYFTPHLPSFLSWGRGNATGEKSGNNERRNSK